MNNLIELAKKHNIELEINKTSANCTEINILNGKEKSFETKYNDTYLLKAIQNNKCVRLMTENLNNPKDLLEDLESIFKVQENDTKNRLSKGTIYNNTESRFINDYQKIKEDLLSLEELKKEYPISSLEISYGYYEEENEIKNAQADLKNDCYFHQYAISITLKKDGVAKNFCDYFYSKYYDFQAFKEYILANLKILVLKLNSSSCQTKKYNVILKNNVVTEIVETFSSMFLAKNIDLKESILCDKFDTKVFSNQISIIEDPCGKKTIIKKAFDEEGTPTSYKEIIKNGVFQKQLNDLEYAFKLKQEPTGNADGIHNLYIQSGNCSYEELIKKLKNGIIVDNVMGLHCGINVKNGNISLQAEGLVVENGCITTALHKIILVTNIFEVLGQVIEVGNDFSRNSLEVFCPSLLIENITIAGEK